MAEPAASPLRREARPFQGRPAGLVSRAAAAVIDSLVVMLTQLLGYAGWALLLFLLDPKSFSWPDTSRLLGLVTWFGILVVYLTLSWRVGGRTYGNLVMGLRVVTRSGRNLRLAHAAARAFLYASFPIGLFWCAVARDKRSLQDLVLRTAVVYDWRPRTSTRRPTASTGPVRFGARGSADRSHRMVLPVPGEQFAGAWLPLMVKSSQVRMWGCCVPIKKDVSITRATTATAAIRSLPFRRSAVGMMRRIRNAAKAGSPKTVITTPSQNRAW